MAEPSPPVECPICKALTATGQVIHGPAEWQMVTVQDAESGQAVKIWAVVCQTHADHVFAPGPPV